MLDLTQKHSVSLSKRVQEIDRLPFLAWWSPITRLLLTQKFKKNDATQHLTEKQVALDGLLLLGFGRESYTYLHRINCINTTAWRWCATILRTDIPSVAQDDVMRRQIIMELDTATPTHRFQLMLRSTIMAIMILTSSRNNLLRLGRSVRLLTVYLLRIPERASAPSSTLLLT